jgi:hypothetical protein
MHSGAISELFLRDIKSFSLRAYSGSKALKVCQTHDAHVRAAMPIGLQPMGIDTGRPAWRGVR